MGGGLAGLGKGAQEALWLTKGVEKYLIPQYYYTTIHFF